MYIIEIIAKLRQDYKNKTGIFAKKNKDIEEEQEYEKCSHIFVPIDSTGKILACNKCGFVINRDKLEKAKNKNFFIKE